MLRSKIFWIPENFGPYFIKKLINALCSIQMQKQECRRKRHSISRVPKKNFNLIECKMRLYYNNNR